eukprot:364442-Chlamydomonas_euryale.AAC.2
MGEGVNNGWTRDNNHASPAQSNMGEHVHELNAGAGQSDMDEGVSKAPSEARVVSHHRLATVADWLGR